MSPTPLRADLAALQRWTLCILAATIPFNFQWQTYTLIFLALITVIRFPVRRIGAGIAQNPALLIWPIFFVLHAASYFWSADGWQSQFDTVSKLSFLLLPIGVGAGMDLDKKWIERFLLCFLAGLAGAALYAISKGWYLHGHGAPESVLFYHELSSGLGANAVYEAWYVLTALAALLLFPWQIFKGWWRIAQALLFILLFTFFILLSSRLLIVLFVVLVAPAALLSLLFSRRKVQGWAIAACVVVLGGILYALVTIQNPIRERYQEVSHPNVAEVFQPDYFNCYPDFSNLTLRLFLWRVGVESTAEHNRWVLGSGNGDVASNLNGRMDELCLPENYEHNINEHNMYIQSLVMLGAPGLFTFLLIILMPFLHWRRSRVGFALFITFQLISSLFMLQESALQTQAGIVFYTLFVSLGWNLLGGRKQLESLPPHNAAKMALL